MPYALNPGTFKTMETDSREMSSSQVRLREEGRKKQQAGLGREAAEHSTGWVRVHCPTPKQMLMTQQAVGGCSRVCSWAHQL